MGKMSREKGKRGEREVFGLLSELLGTVVRRNINARRGDCDSLEIPGWAPEVKRTEGWLEAYWAQAVEQAERLERRPVLFFRQTRQPWVALVDLADICVHGVRRGHRAQLTLEAFADIVREELAAKAIAERATAGIPRANGQPVRIVAPTPTTEAS